MRKKAQVPLALVLAQVPLLVLAQVPLLVQVQAREPVQAREQVQEQEQVPLLVLAQVQQRRCPVMTNTRKFLHQ